MIIQQVTKQNIGLHTLLAHGLTNIYGPLESRINLAAAKNTGEVRQEQVPHHTAFIDFHSGANTRASHNNYLFHIF